MRLLESAEKKSRSIKMTTRRKKSGRAKAPGISDKSSTESKRTRPDPYHTEESYAGLSEVCKRLSKSQDFRTLGDELSGHDSFMVMAGLKQSAKARSPRASLLD
jgi:hypothetical protein